MNSNPQTTVPTDWGRILLIIGIIAGATTLRPTLGGDGQLRYQVVAAWLSGADIPATKYSLIQPLLTLPLAWLGETASLGHREAVKFFNFIVLLFLGRMIYRRVSELKGQTFATDMGLLILGASMLPASLSAYYGEVLTAFTVVAGFLCLGCRPVLAAILIGIGVANTPVMGLPVLLAGLAFLSNRDTGSTKPISKAKSVWPIVWGLIAAGLFFLVETKFKFGSIFSGGYFSAAERSGQTVLPYSDQPGFSYPMFFGVVSILFSFGKGLLFFIPSLMLFFDRSRLRLAGLWSREGTALGLFILGLILVYSKWWAWHGAGFWGPRFFLVLIFPAAYILTAWLRTERSRFATFGLVFILLSSSWVGIASSAFGEFGIISQCTDNDFALELLCWYVPEFSPLWRPFVVYSLGDIVGRVFGSGFAIWQVLVCGYFMKKLTSSGLEMD